MGFRGGAWLDQAEARGLIRPGVRVAGPLAVPAPPAAGCDEKTFLASVVRLAEANGWTQYHTFNSKRSGAGWPDLVLGRLRRDGTADVIFAELKAADGRTTAAQDWWLAVLREAGHRAYLWRPADWDEIAAVLAAET